MRSSDSGTSSRLACSPCQHLAGLAAALGGHRKVLPSFPPLGGWVLAFLLFPAFLLSSSFPARELSLWRGLVSAESWGVEPNGLGPGPALSWTVQLRPPASYREKEASSVPCRGLGSRNGRTFLAPLSLLGHGSARPWLPWGGGPELQEGGDSGPASLMLSLWMRPQSRPRLLTALELQQPHLWGGQEGPRNLFC